MINSIVAGISTALYDTFGEKYEIFGEKIEQDLKEPCFFISCLSPSHTQFLGKRYFRTNNFCIQYFPETDTKRECWEVAESMEDCLEIIHVDGLLWRGTKMHYEVVDGVLNFFVNYDTFIQKTEDETLMDDVSITEMADMKG
jgi:hypothetical protein